MIYAYVRWSCQYTPGSCRPFRSFWNFVMVFACRCRRCKRGNVSSWQLKFNRSIKQWLIQACPNQKVDALWNRFGFQQDRIHVYSENLTFIVFSSIRCDGNSGKAWIGLRDPDNRAENLRWIDQSPFDFKKSDSIQLNNLHGDEECVRFAATRVTWTNYKWIWADLSCSEERHYICKKGNKTFYMHGHACIVCTYFFEH